MNDRSSGGQRQQMTSSTRAVAFAGLVWVSIGAGIRWSTPSSECLPSLVWFDVFVMQTLCVLPLVWWLCIWGHRRFPGDRLLFTIGALISLGALFALGLTAPFRAWEGESISCTVLAVAGVASIALLAQTLSYVGASPVPVTRSTFAVLALVAILTPATYSHARLRNAEIELRQRLDQSRFGEALELTAPIEKLSPRLIVNGRPIGQVHSALQKGVGSLREQVNAPVAENASPSLRLARAQAFAMLGKTTEALNELHIRATPDYDGLILEATIEETIGEWDLGIARYAAARAIAEAEPESPARVNHCARSLKGMGYCLRKAGRMEAAEQAYLDLLKIAPTAEANFLLAQYYEDAQQTSQALTYAKRAMELDPQRFTESGQRLIEKLQTLHFGCWGVYRDQASRN